MYIYKTIGFTYASFMPDTYMYVALSKEAENV